MFLRRIVRRSRGKTLSYWALVESYRTAPGPGQRMLSYLGELTATERKDWAALTEHFQEPLALRQRERKLFELPAEPVPERVTVDVRRVRVETARDAVARPVWPRPIATARQCMSTQSWG